MTIVKLSKDSNSQQSQKKRYRSWIEPIVDKIPAILLGTLIGTYLDLYFVGTNLYTFPSRPMPSIFSINIAFTLISLPILIGVFIYVCNKINMYQKIGFIIILSLTMAVAEKLTEAFGLFFHQDNWKHIYSFYGYTIFFTLIYTFYHWLKRK